MPPYARTLVVQGLGHLEEAGIRLYETLVADGAEAQAIRVRQAILKLETDLTAIAHQTRLSANEEIRKAINASRVRPDTHQAPLFTRPGPSLQAGVDSDVLAAVPGSVGVGDTDRLDKIVPWWVAVERGSSARVGRMVYGYFYDAGGQRHRPSQAEFRQHPVFLASKPGQRMIIKNAITPHWFLRDGSLAAQTLWHARVEKARAAFRREVIAATRAPVRKPPGKGPLRGRKGPRRGPGPGPRRIR